MTDLERLGKEIADLQETYCEGDQSVDQARALWRNRGAIPSASSSGRRRWVVAAAGGVAAALACVALYIFSSGQPMPVDEANQVGQWITVPAGQQLPIDFPEGSQVVFTELSKGRVSGESARHKTVVLETGAVRVKVVHRKDSRWKVVAGPYQISVTGTRFDVDWRPDSTALTLHLYEGEVIITGPMMQEGQKIKPNQRLVANAAENRIERSALSDRSTNGEPVPEPRPSSERSSAVTSEADKNPHPKAPVRKRQKPSSDPDWTDVLRGDGPKAALDLVTAQGLDRHLARADAKTLLLLGDTARLAGRLTMARQAYETLRRRFPKSSPANAAAMALGRMAFDQQRDYCKAAHWLTIYLKEQKNSGLRREALGRLMEAHQRCGDAPASRRIAEQYLTAYPHGPLSSLAKEILEP